MDKYRAEMKKYYYDPTKYKTYLEQLGDYVSDGEEVIAVRGSRFAVADRGPRRRESRSATRDPRNLYHY